MTSTQTMTTNSIRKPALWDASPRGWYTLYSIIKAVTR